MTYRVKSTYLPDQYDFAGNILDQFDQATYQLTLFMKPDYKTRDPAKWILTDKDVIIAQTGVTGTLVKTLTVENLVVGGLVSTNIKFQLEQPQSVDLFDRIISTKERFGYGKITNTIMFMRIRFLGYTSDQDDNDGAGEPAPIGNDIYLRMDLTKVNIQVSETGSVYDFEALDTGTSTMTKIWRFPKNGYTVGETIREHLENLAEVLTEFHQEQGNQFKIDFSNLLKPDSDDDWTNQEGLIQDDEIYDASSAESLFTRISNAADAAGSVDDRQSALKNIPKIDDSTPDNDYEEIVDNRGIPFKAGQNLYEYLVTLLSANDEFYSMITRLENIDEPDSEVDNQKGVLRWARMNMSHDIIQLDEQDHDFVREYVLQPTLYDNVRNDMITDARETTLTPDDGQGRFEDMWNKQLIRKTYDYLFTGLNDQIQSLNIDWNPTIGILVARQDGRQSLEAGDVYAKHTEASKDPEQLYNRDQGLQLANQQARSFSDDLPGEPDPANTYGTTTGYSDNNSGQQQVINTESIPATEAPVKTASRKHTLFGHLVNQSENAQFLLQLNMTVRGDPWFIDNGRIASSTDDQMYMRGSDNCIFLTIRSPERYDPDIDDEDNNTGYWQFSNASRMFSGVYRVIKAVNNFQDGQFTSELECQQVLTVNIIEGSN